MSGEREHGIDVAGSPGPPARQPPACAVTGPPRLQRSHGRGDAVLVRDGGRTLPRRLYEEGCARLRWMRRSNGAGELVLVNTAGGLTGGDRFAVALEAGRNAAATLTSVAMEKIYRSPGGEARIAVLLRLRPGARVAWLPQETILFDGGRLVRHNRVRLAPDSRLLWCEAVIFGRIARGEEVRDGRLRERLDLHLDDRPLFADRLDLEGDLAARLDRPALGGGARAMATALLHLPDAAMAEAALKAWRQALAPLAGAVTGGASRIAGLVRARILAREGAMLRTALAALVEGGRPWLGGPPRVPRSWDL